MGRIDTLRPSGLTGVRVAGAWLERRIWLPALLSAGSVAAGHFVASGSVRHLSLLALALAVPLAAQLSASGFLVLTIILLPLPLFMQGLGRSITPVLILGAWISYVALPTRNGTATPLGSEGIQQYALPLVAVSVAALVAFGRADSTRTASDLASLGNLALAMSLFVLCMLVFRTPSDIRRAFRALALAGVAVLAVTGIQLLFPGLRLPGMVAPVGAVQSNELLSQANLRIGGPLGDYELLAELASLVGIVALFLSLHTSGTRRAAWLGVVLASLVGIGVTSTRSGFITLVLGALAIALFLGRKRARILGAIAGTAALSALSIPVLHALQSRFETGFLIERLAATPTDQGLMRMLDRASVWPYFTDRLGGGADLFLGRAVAFDLDTWGTYAHSLPLTLVVTVGIAGAVAFFALLGTIAWRCLSAWRRTADPYPVLGFALVLMFATHELKVEYVRVTSYVWFVWALLGVCAASAAVALRERS